MALSTISGTTGITDATITSAKLADFAAAVDLNGVELILDADQDTTITADTDDTIDIKIGGADDFQFTANTFTALSGSTIKANTIAETTSASGVTIDGLLIKDGVLGANTVDSVAYVDGSIDNAHIADDAIDSEHYADGSIDNAHIADDAIDSEHYADGSIDTAHIADNQITLAKMAGGTDGNIISYDASGDPVAIATGSDGQVLTSTGAGSPPAFEAIPASAVTAINNATANELVTIGGTTTELDAESGLTFSGTTLTVTNKIGINENSVAATNLHITSGDVGTIPTLVSDFDEVCIENSTSGITFMGTTSGGGGLCFGDTADADVGYIFYYHAQDQMWFRVNGTLHFKIASNGDLTATDTSIGSISDERVKENISDLTYDVAKFKQLRPRTFDWKNPDDHDGRSNNRGFIAQEIEAVDDYWVREDLIDSTHADFSLLDSITRSNAVIENGRIIAHGISESDWETGKSNAINAAGETYPNNSTWAASAEDARITKTSTFGKKDSMYISVINQLITRIETLETKVQALEDA